MSSGYSWILPLVDSISNRSELSLLLVLGGGLLSPLGFLCCLTGGARKTAKEGGEKEHMSRCHSTQHLRTRGIQWVAYLLRAIRQRPGAVKYCAQASVLSPWSNQTNPARQTTRKLNLFYFYFSSLAKQVVVVRAPGSLLLKSWSFLSHGFGEFNNNKKWRQSRCSVWSCCVIKNIHVNTGD